MLGKHSKKLKITHRSQHPACLYQRKDMVNVFYCLNRHECIYTVPFWWKKSIFHYFLSFTGHIQISQVPSRCEPDTDGEINYPYIFHQIAKQGYSGWIGCEYTPRGIKEPLGVQERA